MRRPILGMLLCLACMSIVPATSNAIPDVGAKHNGFSITDERYLAKYVDCVHADGCDYGRNIVDDNLVSGKVPTQARVSEAITVMDRQMHPARYAPAPTSSAVPATASTATATTYPTTDTSGVPLEAIRSCESGGNYSTDTGNGFYGAYQFTQQTWESVGGSGNPAAASPAEQDARAAQLYSESGSSPWPVCGQ